MPATTTPRPQSAVSAAAISAAERRAIDESCRVPVLYFAASAVVWLRTQRPSLSAAH